MAGFPFQQIENGSKAHLASCIVCTRESFLVGKGSQSVTLTHLHLMLSLITCGDLSPYLLCAFMKQCLDTYFIV